MDVIVVDVRVEVEDGIYAELVPTSLKYYRSDPLAVSMVMQHRGEEIEWQFSRDLLRHGLEGSVGGGDVTIWPKDTYRDQVVILLDSPEGQAYLTVDSRDIRDFLRETEKMIPYGTETESVTADLDEWLEGLL